MDNKKLIGNRINEALGKRNMLQKELAKKIGVKDNIISYFASGERAPNVEQIIKISEALNVSIDFLCGRTTVLNPDLDYKEMNSRLGLSEKSLEILERFQNNSSEEARKNKEEAIKLSRKVVGDKNWDESNPQKYVNFNESLIVEFLNMLIESAEYSEDMSIFIRQSADYIIGAYEPIKEQEEFRKQIESGLPFSFTFDGSHITQNNNLDFRTYQLTKDFERFIVTLMKDNKARERIIEIYKNNNQDIHSYFGRGLG